MNTFIEKTFIRVPFETLASSLIQALHKDGFCHVEIPDYENNTNDQVLNHVNKKMIFCVYNSLLYKEMVVISPVDGIVLPCYVSVIETYPGETAVIPFNPTQLIAKDMQNAPLRNLADEVSRRLNKVIGNLKALFDRDPDLVTSWE